MKFIKYIIVSLLMIVAFLATGERFVFHLAHFEDTFWGITFEYGLYGQEGSKKLVKEKIAKALEENDLDVFLVDTKYVSENKEVKTVYGTQEHFRICVAEEYHHKHMIVCHRRGRYCF